jgi:hypothetical protein
MIHQPLEVCFLGIVYKGDLLHCIVLQYYFPCEIACQTRNVCGLLWVVYTLFVLIYG